MSTATLVRRSIGVVRRGREFADGDTQEQILFEGELAGAIAAAKALPVAERIDVKLETETAHFGPDDFDFMTPDLAPLHDLELTHGAGLIRVEKGALERLYEPAAGLIPPMRIVRDNIDTLTAILNHKVAIGEIEEIAGKRIIRITAADIDAA